MNLHSRKVRLPIAALGVTALCSGGIGIFASPAFAATAIALNSGATSIAVGNFGTASTATANAAYAIKVQESSLSNMAIAVASAPAGGNVSFDKSASNAAATTNGFTTVGVSEVQTLTFSSAPTTGSYTVANDDDDTGPLTDYSAAALQTALNGFIGDGNDVTVTGSGLVFTVTFGGSLSGTNVSDLSVSTSALADTNATAVTVTPATTTSGGAAGTVSTGSLGDSDYLYVTGDTPGAYTFRLFQDTNTNNAYDSADERSSALVTMNVYDVGGSAATSTTADDVAPVLAATTPSAVGDPIVADVTYSKPLSMSDARGGSAVTGLAGRLAALTFIDVTPSYPFGGVSSSTNNTPTYTPSTSKITYAVGTPSSAETITLRGDLAATSGATNATFGTKAIVVSSNNVDNLDLGATKVEGKVMDDGSGTVTVKSGTPTVAYAATAEDNNGNPVVGAKVNFTVAGTEANIAKLTTDGTAVSTTSTTSKVYSAVTDTKGVATLKVTTSDSSSGTYSVNAASNGESGSPGLTVTYAAAAATKIVTTSTTTELTPTVGTTTVTLKGTVKDQFDAPFVPSSSDPQQVGVQIPDGTNVGYAPLSASGTFSYVYTAPTSPAPAVGDTTGFDFTYGSVADNASPGGTIRWASAAVASKITLTTPVTGAKSVNPLGNYTPDPGQSNNGTPAFGNSTGEVTGTVVDAANAPLAYKSVTLKGGNGVWFSTTNSPDADDKLVESLDVVTSASGAISGAYVYFSKTGEHTVTATSGSATATSTVTVDSQSSNQGWNVSVDSVSGAPGSTLIVTGKVTDIFGNGVENAYVLLSTGTSTVGSLGSTGVSTNSAGIFSTTFATGSNSSGVVDLTAEIDNNPSGVLTPNADLVAAGFTAPPFVDKVTGKITIAATKLTLSSTAKVVAGGSGGTAKLSGTYLPDTSVDIYSKESGENSYSLMDSVTTDGQGDWGTSTKVDKSTYFLAKANGLSSPSDLTQVWSSVSLTAKALGKGKVSLSANGDPNTKSTLTFYRSTGGADPVLKKMTSSASGSGKVTVSLPKGTRSVYVTYKAPGTNLGTSKTLKVNVK